MNRAWPGRADRCGPRRAASPGRAADQPPHPGRPPRGGRRRVRSARPAPGRPGASRLRVRRPRQCPDPVRPGRDLDGRRPRLPRTHRAGHQHPGLPPFSAAAILAESGDLGPLRLRTGGGHARRTLPTGDPGMDRLVNKRRLHSACRDIAPAEYEREHYRQIAVPVTCLNSTPCLWRWQSRGVRPPSGEVASTLGRGPRRSPNWACEPRAVLRILLRPRGAGGTQRVSSRRRPVPPAADAYR